MVRTVSVDDFFDKLPESELDIEYRKADARFRTLQLKTALCNGAVAWVNENWEAAEACAEKWGLAPQEFMEEMLIRAFETYSTMKESKDDNG